MRRSAMWLAVGVASVVPFVAMAAPAEEAGMSDPYVKLAVARAKAEAAIRDAMPLANEQQSGWMATWQATDAGREKSASALQRAMQQEETKPQESRNEKAVQELRQKWEAQENAWRAFLQKRAAFRAQYDQGVQGIMRVNELLAQIASMEKSWKDAGLDVAGLENLYAALEKRVSEARSQIRKAMDEQTGGLREWEGGAKAEASAPASEAPPAKR
jgi:hypothetical protein